MYSALAGACTRIIQEGARECKGRALQRVGKGGERGMSKEQKAAKADKSALESGKTSLNTLRERHGLPTIKSGPSGQCLAKLDGKVIIFDGIVPWTRTVGSPVPDRQYDIKAETLHLGFICGAPESGNTC